MTQAEREGEERMQSSTTTVGRKVRGVPKHQGRSLVQWAKEVHQPVVNDRAGKGGAKCWSPPQEEAVCLSGATRRDGLRLPACARTGCECRGVPACGAKNEQTQREPEMRRQRRDCDSSGPKNRGHHNGRVQQETRLVTMAANRAIIPKRLIHG